MCAETIYDITTRWKMSKYTLEQVRDRLRAEEKASIPLVLRREFKNMADAIDALLRERESAKAGVTDEMTEAACRAYAIASDNPWPYSKEEWNDDDRAYMRAALKVVAPMLSSARVLGGWQLVPVEATDEMCEAAWESDASDYVGEHRRIHRADLAYKAMLAAAPKPTNVWPVDAREKAFSLAREMLQKGSAKPETEE